MICLIRSEWVLDLSSKATKKSPKLFVLFLKMMIEWLIMDNSSTGLHTSAKASVKTSSAVGLAELVDQKCLFMTFDRHTKLLRITLLEFFMG